jgi:hypothetical protein
VALRARTHPLLQALPDIPVQRLEFLGGVPNAEIVAPPPNARVQFCPYCRQGVPQPAACQGCPETPAYRLQGFLAGPPQGHQLPRPPRSACMEVETEKRKPFALPGDDTRRRRMQRQLEPCQALGDGAQRLFRCLFCSTHHHDVIGLPLPHAATSLVASAPASEQMTQLTAHAVTELMSFAEQCEGLCPATPPNSGIDAPLRGTPVSAPTSRRSSRR